MKRTLWLFLIFAISRCCTAQEDCTRTVLVSFYDQLTKDEIQTLKPEDLEIKADSKVLPVLAARRDFNNRLLVLLETQGAAENEHLDDLVSTVTLQARQVSGANLLLSAYFLIGPSSPRVSSVIPKNAAKPLLKSWKKPAN